MRPKTITASPGDLLVIEEYDCEGTEAPWGFRIEALDGVTDISGADFRRRVRSPRNRVHLTRGETCLVVAVAGVAHPAIDAYCIVLARGAKIGVHTRFLRHPDTHRETQ